MALDKTFDAKASEERIYAAWEQAGAFKAGANASRPETYSIMIPPPNVTGVLHMGHAFNNTLQDILIRWKRMQGYDTLWQPGTDHAGIATQMVVERKLAEEGKPARRDWDRGQRFPSTGRSSPFSITTSRTTAHGPLPSPPMTRARTAGMTPTRSKGPAQRSITWRQTALPRRW